MVDENPNGPDQEYARPLGCAVKVNDWFVQGVPNVLAVGIAGFGLTVTLTLPAVLVQPFTTRITE